MGDTSFAEKHFHDAIAASGPDGFVLAAYANSLNDQRRPAEVTALLRVDSGRTGTPSREMRFVFRGSK